MSGYARKEDALPCPVSPSGAHDWHDAQMTSDSPEQYECSWCAAIILAAWWGWIFLLDERGAMMGTIACVEDFERPV